MTMIKNWRNILLPHRVLFSIAAVIAIVGSATASVSAGPAHRNGSVCYQVSGPEAGNLDILVEQSDAQGYSHEYIWANTRVLAVTRCGNSYQFELAHSASISRK